LENPKKPALTLRSEDHREGNEMTTLNGLPAHVLLVHAIVVLLPLAALLVVLTAVWPSARRRFAGANVLLSWLVVVLVPLTTSAGEWLERRVPQTSALHDHTELGDTAIWVALPVAVVALAVWWREREASVAAGSPPPGPMPRRAFLAPLSTTVTTVVTVLAVAAAVAAVVDIYGIGDSGARAAWQGHVSSTPAPRPSGRPHD
jgi:hypothetical protein